MEYLDFKDIDNYLLTHTGNIIHQVWFGTIPNKKAAKKALEALKKYKDSWIIKNPNWVYMCWNLYNCKELIYQIYPEHREMFDSYQWEIQKCDCVRYFILHRYGGLYADMDYFCAKPFSIVFEKYKNSIYLVETPNKINNTTHISNSLMYSKPGHIFWRKLFIELEKNKKCPYYYGRHLSIMFTTGPGILNKVYNRYKFKYKLEHFPFEKFHPLGLNTENIKCKDVYSIHMGKGSWETNDSKALIFFYSEHKIICFILCIMLVNYILLKTV